jgi:hypothetical protein
MKNIGIVLGCACVGGLLGLLLGIGELNYVKKSQRETTFPVLAVVGVAIGVIGGIKVAAMIGEDDEVNAKYGLAAMETYEGKEGRKWFRQSKWVNPGSGLENVITTRYLDGVVLTLLNEKVMYNHQTQSGAKKDIERLHQFSVYEIIKRVQSGEIKLR